VEYQAVVESLLEKATSDFSSRIQHEISLKTYIEGTADEIPELICYLQKVAVTVSSKWKLRNLDLGSSEPLFNPRRGLDDCSHAWDSISPKNEQKGRLDDLPSSSTTCVIAHSVLGQALFDAYVPKNIKGWDIRFSGSVNGHRLHLLVDFHIGRKLDPFVGQGYESYGCCLHVCW